MSEFKTQCADCGVAIRRYTADHYDGRCVPCYRKAAAIPPHDLAMSRKRNPMDLASYCNLVRTLPVPSKTQCEAFTHWVAEAHSWYKRIPILGDGVPFIFYLDPGAGQDRVQHTGSGWEVAPRTERGFHYTAIPTVDYLRRFGHLAFATGTALKAGILGENTARIETGFGVSVLDQGMEHLLPVEVETNAVWLTGIIHPYANQSFIWSWIASCDVERCPWPEESGGLETFAKIHARCCELTDDSKVKVSFGDYSRGVDAVLADLIEPERRRQRQIMVSAMERLFRLLGQM